MQIYSFSPFGYEGALVTVEVDLRRGIPAVDIVGLADNAVKESRERMQAAIRNSGFDFPLERVLISLSPADLKKEGAGFDLPIALGVLAARKASYETDSSQNREESSPILIMGELELSGKIRAVRGIHAAAATAMANGIRRCIVPAANTEEAREAAGMKVFGAENLKEAFAALSTPEVFVEAVESAALSKKLPSSDTIEINGILFPRFTEGYEFGDIKGQEQLIRGLQVAAAGGHNVIAIGSPGCGKTMALQKFPALLPLLTPEEAQPVTRILSLSGMLSPSQPLVRIPPFRMPHQTASIEGMCGGGTNCRPGEISLAHNGVLFLDEAAEFKTSVLQMLRVPLETGKVTLARAGRSTVFPADFQLLMAANPCPCGNFGSETKLCLCSSRAIEMYWKKFSAPLLDRIDIRISVKNENDAPRASAKPSETPPFTTAKLRMDIATAAKRQRLRQNKKNSKLSPSETAIFCKIDESSKTLLTNAQNRYGFSPRAVASILKVGRTIADMEDSEHIQKKHIEEAVQFRKSFTNFMLPAD